MFQGLRTLIFRVKPADLKKATAWYAELLGKKPYFEEPFYVGFNVGGFELGLNPAEPGDPVSGGTRIELGNNVETYWGVADVAKALARCRELGAKAQSDVQDVGDGIQVATVRDPFGNLFGLIRNPRFKIEA